MKTYLIEENVLQGLVNYLATRPWNEVKDAMPVLISLKEHECPPVEPIVGPVTEIS